MDSPTLFPGGDKDEGLGPGGVTTLRTGVRPDRRPSGVQPGSWQGRVLAGAKLSKQADRAPFPHSWEVQQERWGEGGIPGKQGVHFCCAGLVLCECHVRAWCAEATRGGCCSPDQGGHRTGATRVLQVCCAASSGGGGWPLLGAMHTNAAGRSAQPHPAVGAQAMHATEHPILRTHTPTVLVQPPCVPMSHVLPLCHLAQKPSPPSLLPG